MTQRDTFPDPLLHGNAVQHFRGRRRSRWLAFAAGIVCGVILGCMGTFIGLVVLVHTGAV